MVDTKLVNTFIVGAPKCGTTSIAAWLSDHPQAYMSPEKEPHYFYTPYHVSKNAKQYMSLFLAADPSDKVIAEASVWYLFSKSAVQKILDYNPNAKFVVCIRNPTDMAVSLHAQKLVSNGTSYERLVSFEDAWAANDERLSGKPVGMVGPSCDTRHMAYKYACSIGTQLEALLSEVGVNQVHVILIDDLKRNPRNVWLGLQAFLELKDDGRSDFEAHNIASAPKSLLIHRALNRISWLKQSLGIGRSFNLLSWVHSANTHETQYKKPAEKFLDEVSKEFEAEVKKLELILDRDLSHWSR
ncbi:Uncharacterised protein [BD1-7 clade bacterium]|uniref:Sulfotransferase domain-containing protein n=1 Tax=BD1-7 clade bacterium TaxID=2029982 RepID=A0A5S9MTQ0_9GAMM|nr:Uncharacterised protein [BD1-7 clade bacterium]CAA0083797.1 Uncharacterised protein [BD1-7 clade bacterium]